MEEQSEPKRGAGAGRTLLVAWAHLAVLWSFAFAQPLLDLLGDSPEFFVARGNTRGDILLLAFTLVLVPPTVLALVEAAFLRVPRVREALHLAFVAVLVAALALQVVTDVLDGLPAYAVDSPRRRPRRRRRGALRPPGGSAHVPHGAQSRPGRLPRAVPARVAGVGPGPPAGRRQGSGGRRGHRRAGRDGRLRRVLRGLAARPAPAHRREPLSQLRRARPALDLVPKRHDRRLPDAAGRAGAA